MAEWLKNLPKPAGIMACNDDRAQQVIEACKVAELHMSDDVCVIGVDNDDLKCDLCDPPLSSIALNVEKAGYEAAELLHRMINTKKKITEDTISKIEYGVEFSSLEHISRYFHKETGKSLREFRKMKVSKI